MGIFNDNIINDATDTVKSYEPITLKMLYELGWRFNPPFTMTEKDWRSTHPKINGTFPLYLPQQYNPFWMRHTGDYSSVGRIHLDYGNRDNKFSGIGHELGGGYTIHIDPTVVCFRFELGTDNLPLYVRKDILMLHRLMEARFESDQIEREIRESTSEYREAMSQKHIIL